ncbi:hypothetical protein TNCV_1486921 [Trichonephila clavipes]|nr:hypothetical protein TNCV_1486921 [Trichonephila clavipes]
MPQPIISRRRVLETWKAKHDGSGGSAHVPHQMMCTRNPSQPYYGNRIGKDLHSISTCLLTRPFIVNSTLHDCGYNCFVSDYSSFYARFPCVDTGVLMSSAIC